MKVGLLFFAKTAANVLQEPLKKMIHYCHEKNMEIMAGNCFANIEFTLHFLLLDAAKNNCEKQRKKITPKDRRDQ